MQEDAFGWLSPQHHLMSWALSCLSLKEHYQDLTLYSDSQAAHILIDKIGLPYSEVVVAYDNFKCLPIHWALAKVKTYSMQERPFLHVDGDIYLARPLPKRIEKSRLAAQNREYGTSYYKRMMDRLLACPGIRIPDYLEQGLREESVSSYNMGFFGGKDLNFIRHYCEEVFKFFEENRMNDPTCSNSAISCNVIFEQVFFAVMADKENRKVTTVLQRAMRDEGYTGKEFCDIAHFNRHRFFHMLGGHKSSKTNCRNLELILLRKYPETYERITNLFRTTKTYTAYLSLKYNNSSGYNEFAQQTKAIFSRLNHRIILGQEQQTARYYDFLETSPKQRKSMTLKRNPHLQIYSLDEKEKQSIKNTNKLYGNDIRSYSDIAITPTLFGNGIKETPIDDATHNMIALADGTRNIAAIKQEFRKLFSSSLRKQGAKINVCFHNAVHYLLFHGIVTIAGWERGGATENRGSDNAVSQKSRIFV